MSVWIFDGLYKFIDEKIKERYPKRRTHLECRPRSWQSHRWIQVQTVLRDNEIHYEYINGYVQLHLEGKYNTEEYKPFRQYLMANIPLEKMEWKQVGNIKRGCCQIKGEANDWNELIEKFYAIIDIVDPVISEYVKNDSVLFPNNLVKKAVPVIAYKLDENSLQQSSPEPQRKFVKDLDFDDFIIPPYQRPYKWTAKNVNQLISDILLFKDKLQYRLGTLVLHKGEIVDGQQRTITLCLIIKTIYDSLKNETQKEKYESFISKLVKFANNASFPNRYSLHNVVENLHVIRERLNELDDSALDFILNKCEFVVIELNDVSEAFQFFDSQNARGKDLEPHDLLKAFHLREIEEIKKEDASNIAFWQSMKTSQLRDIFITLYRAKNWSQGKIGRFFTKDNINIFKGISVDSKKRYPFYQLEVIAHIFSNMYNSDPVRKVDQREFEYPFSLDGKIVNGSRFFDMIRHYTSLYERLMKSLYLGENETVQVILSVIKNYEGMWRTGDQYILNMFYTLMLYYIDKFGFEEIDKIIPKFFVWAYSLRLTSPAVQLATMDNYARETTSMFRLVHDAQNPYDVINISQASLERNDVQCTKCEAIIEVFKSLNKFVENEG